MFSFFGKTNTVNNDNKLYWENNEFFYQNDTFDNFKITKGDYISCDYNSDKRICHVLLNDEKIFSFCLLNNKNESFAYMMNYDNDGKFLWKIFGDLHIDTEFEEFKNFIMDYSYLILSNIEAVKEKCDHIEPHDKSYVLVKKGNSYQEIRFSPSGNVSLYNTPYEINSTLEFIRENRTYPISHYISFYNNNEKHDNFNTNQTYIASYDAIDDLFLNNSYEKNEWSDILKNFF
jgi:hypothetical protein